MNRRFWTIIERRRAVALRSQGYSYGQISCLMPQRSPDAIAAHLRALRLSTVSSVEGPTG